MSIFLSSVLREIPYLAAAQDETISAIAKTMTQTFLETGAIYYDVGDAQGCMSIIQHGQIDLITTLDNNTSSIVLEKLTRGAILGANMVLNGDHNKVTAQCSSPVQIYSIEKERFFDLVKNDADCFAKMESIHKELVKVPAADRILDFN